MGCASSDLQGQNLLQQRRLEELELKNHEQQNLLRFKVEVLVNMLAVEERKNELSGKRIDTLKWLLYSQGVNEEALTKIVSKLEHEPDARSSTDQRQLLHAARIIDLTGALTRMRDEFEAFKEDIIRAFASEEGKIVPSLPAEEFMKQVYTVTEHITKADLHIISLRFDDGFGSVSVPEFLDFFSTPVDVRTAKQAANAVRMSLDLLELDVEVMETEKLLKADIEVSPHPLPLLCTALTHPQGDEELGTHGLDRGAKRLLLMWMFVSQGLEQALNVFQEDPDQQTVTKEVFERTLQELCGRHSTVLEAAAIEGKITLRPAGKVSPLPQESDKENSSLLANSPKAKPVAGEKEEPLEIEPLEVSDIDLITERFELDGSVHYGHFLAFFSDIHSRLVSRKVKDFVCLPESLLGTTPFRYSTEWATIRQSSVRQSMSLGEKQKSFTAPRKLEDQAASTAPAAAAAAAAAAPAVGAAKDKPKPAADPKKAVDSTADAKTPKDAAKDAAKDADDKADDKDSKDVPVNPPPRSILSFLMCGRQSAPKVVDPPTDAPQDKGDKDDKGSADDKHVHSALSDSEDSEGGLPLKQDTGFSTPKLKAKSRRVQLPPEDDKPADRPKAIDLVQREGLGDGDKRPQQSAPSSGSRFRRRTADESPQPAARDVSMDMGSKPLPDDEDEIRPTAGERHVRSRLDEDDEEEDDDESFVPVSKVHSNVRGKAGFTPKK